MKLLTLLCTSPPLLAPSIRHATSGQCRHNVRTTSATLSSHYAGTGYCLWFPAHHGRARPLVFVLMSLATDTLIEIALAQRQSGSLVVRHKCLVLLCLSGLEWGNKLDLNVRYHKSGNFPAKVCKNCSKIIINNFDYFLWLLIWSKENIFLYSWQICIIS